MQRILITGATGNIGFEVIRFLTKIGTSDRIIAGVRNIEKAKSVFQDYPKLEYLHFDFENFDSFDHALKGIDKLFLLRPPHISNVEKYFKPLVLKAQEKNINQIVFLSVQGAEKSRVIPHHKIERMIKEYGFDFIFLRPSYFMQNLTTTLIEDIKKKREIILPAGKAKFNWVDIQNIGEAAAILLKDFEKYKNREFEITGLENENFESVSALINSVIDTPITYRDVNPLQFYFIKKNQGVNDGMIFVMFLLHFLPRFQKEPQLSAFYEKITGKEPTSLNEFIEREKDKFSESK